MCVCVVAMNDKKGGGGENVAEDENAKFFFSTFVSGFLFTPPPNKKKINNYFFIFELKCLILFLCEIIGRDKISGLRVWFSGLLGKTLSSFILFSCKYFPKNLNGRREDFEKFFFFFVTVF